MPTRKPTRSDSPAPGAGGRSPFDPALLPDLNPQPDDQATAGDRPWSVSQLCQRIAGALAAGLPAQVRVVGEVSGFADRTHWWFALKDDAALVSCAMFASQARRCPFTPENGQQVVATGRVDHYAKAGKTQLYVESLEPVGLGPLEIAFRKLFEELKRQGYFDPARKQPLPRFPQRIAIITSRAGAALQDALDTLRRRAPMIEVVVVDVRVQGPEAAGEIARALAALGARSESLGLDAIMLTRGGGSMEDLWAFNERIVADALLACPLPVVAAIGHETDVTIAELVADERAATPTQAAMRLSPDKSALAEQVSALGSRLASSLHRRVALERERVRGASRLPIFASPRALLREPASRTAAAEERLRGALARSLRAQRDRVASLRNHLEAVSPQAVLARGYSVTTDAAGRVLVSAGCVRAGQRVATRLRDGSFESDVVDAPADDPAGKQSSDRAADSLRPSAEASQRRSGSTPSDRSLFD